MDTFVTVVSFADLDASDEPPKVIIIPPNGHSVAVPHRHTLHGYDWAHDSFEVTLRNMIAERFWTGAFKQCRTRYESNNAHASGVIVYEFDFESQR